MTKLLNDHEGAIAPRAFATATPTDAAAVSAPIRRRQAAGGATLLELVIGLAALGLLAAMLSATVAEGRRQAGLTQGLSNLQRFAAGTSSYAAAYQDRFWGFSWPQHHAGPFGVAATRTQATADQAVEILRRRGGVTMDRVTSWYAGANYSHLPLLDHLGVLLRSEFVVAPEDELLMLWQSDPDNIVNLPSTQRPGGSALSRWGYSSSYELGPAFQEADARWYDGTGNLVETAAQHGGIEHDTWYLVTKGIGSRFLHEVSFPSQKVMVFERVQRHFGPRDLYFMEFEARVPLLFADGAAAVKRTKDCNYGFRPNAPAQSAPTLVLYRPSDWEPPPASGNASQTLIGHYRWTRGGLKGRDFGAAEISTSNW